MRLVAVLCTALTAFAGACTTSLGPEAGPDAGAGGKSDDPGDPGPGADAGACAKAQVSVKAKIPTVMLLVDASGSMLDSFGQKSRWQAVFDTLMDPQSGVVSLLDSQVRFGLSLYASLYDPYGRLVGSCPNTFVVPPAIDNRDNIYQMWSGVTIYGDYQTPTGPAIADAAGRLAFVPSDEPRAIVLATDGEPDTCAAPQSDGSTEARNESIAAAQNAHAQGIDTYVISVGAEIASGHLQELANVGVGLPRSGSESAPYYRALDPEQLVSAFQTIVAGVRSCEFELDNEIDLDYAATGTVLLDGRELEFDREWSLLDGRTLALEGDACDEWKRSGDHDLSAEFTCGAIVK